MKLLLRESEATYRPDWDTFVEHSDGATFFLLSAWTTAVARLTSERVHRLTAEDAAGKILAGLIFSARRGYGLALARKPWATPYCGPSFASGLSCSCRGAISSLFANHMASNYDYVRIDTGPDFSDVLGFRYARAWKINLRSTYQFQHDGSQLLSRVQPAVRRHLMKSSAQSLAVSPSDDPGPLFEMYRSLYERQGVSLRFDAGDFTEFCHTLPRRNVGLWYASQNQSPIAGMLITQSKGRHFYCLSAFRRDHADSAGPTVLLHHYIDQVVKHGEIFDFVGANPETPGITRFKCGFNPRECLYASLEHTSQRDRLCKLLMPVFRFGRNLFSPVRRDIPLQV